MSAPSRRYFKRAPADVERLITAARLLEICGSAHVETTGDGTVDLDLVFIGLSGASAPADSTPVPADLSTGGLNVAKRPCVQCGKLRDVTFFRKRGRGRRKICVACEDQVIPGSGPAADKPLVEHQEGRPRERRSAAVSKASSLVAPVGRGGAARPAPGRSAAIGANGKAEADGLCVQGRLCLAYPRLGGPAKLRYQKLGRRRREQLCEECERARAVRSIPVSLATVDGFDRVDSLAFRAKYPRSSGDRGG